MTWLFKAYDSDDRNIDQNGNFQSHHFVVKKNKFIFSRVYEAIYSQPDVFSARYA